jgi:hypothetical protein
MYARCATALWARFCRLPACELPACELTICHRSIVRACRAHKKGSAAMNAVINRRPSHARELDLLMWLSQPGPALTQHPVRFFRRDRPGSERHRPIALAERHVIMPGDGLLLG